uniref:Uncharacterized protein n=1 Tax=Phlebotomus papatasi TaxID=29031 RepID=A0A1B0D7L6_PHLPP
MWSQLLGSLFLIASVSALPWWRSLRAPYEIPEWQEKHPALMELVKRTNVDFGSRIVNGNEAFPHQFPYQTALVVRLENESTICGGSLISASYVLTAAHCTDLSVFVTVYLGVHNLSDYTEGTRVVQTVFRSDIVVHELYNTSGYQNDISVIKMPMPVTFNDAIRPDGGRTTDASWDGTDVLHYVKLSVISNTACRALYPTLQESNICTRGENRSGTCQGDSGGPLVIMEDDGIYTQIGIVSFGSGIGCSFNWPNVFVRLTSFLCWLGCHTDLPVRL